MMRIAVCALPVFVALAIVGAAQPQPGDWIISDYPGNYNGNGGIYRMNPVTGATTLIAAGGGITYFFNAVCMAANNRDLMGVRADDYLSIAGSLQTLTPTGGLLSSAGVVATPAALDLDQNGTWIVATGTSSSTHYLRRVNPTTGLVSAIAAWSSGFLNACCVDGDTGHYIMGSHTYGGGSGHLVRVNRLTGATTLIASGLGNVSGVAFEPQTGAYLVSRQAAPGLVRVTPNGSQSAVASALIGTNANCLRVNEENGDVLVVNGATVKRIRTTGVLLSQFTLPSLTPSGIEIYGSRKVSGTGTATANSVYTVRFAFPASPNAMYVAALSTGMRPGLPLNDGSNRVINVNVNDPVFQLSLGGVPGFTTGFTGVLDAQGNATGTITIPAGTPAGIRLFVTAAAVNGAMPSGLDTANTWGFTTNQ